MNYTEKVVIDYPMRGADGKMWCHMAAQDLETLHKFAKRIGLSVTWFQRSNSGLPHYDICSSRIRANALSNGAVMVSRKYLYLYIKAKM